MTLPDFSRSEHVRIGVVADTHVPDRVFGLHPDLLDVLARLEVNVILHAGDICTPSVLADLSKIAPVIAVRGNRDWAFKDVLPWNRELDISGNRICLMHGHGTLWDYLWDKGAYLLNGYRLERYQKLVDRYSPQADVVVFGHTHRPVVRHVDGKLFFNPGSAAFEPPEGGHPSLGVLESRNGQIMGQIFEMRKMVVRARKWGFSTDIGSIS